MIIMSACMQCVPVDCGLVTHTGGSAMFAAVRSDKFCLLTLCRICKVTRSKTAMVPLPVQHHRSDPTTAKQCTMLPKEFAGTS